MLLIRFTADMLGTVIAIVAVGALDTWWAVALATLVLLALLTDAIVQVLRYLGATENRSTFDEELLETAGLVEPDTGLPSRRRWNEAEAEREADAVAARGPVPVPEAWQGPDAPHRVLLVTSGFVASQELRDAVLEGRPAEEVGALVIAPTLADTATRLRMGDASEAAPRAEGIVRATVDTLQRLGVRARGHIGAADPAVAVSDGLRTYDADRAVVARHRNGPVRYREDAPVEAAAAAFGVPLQELDLATSDPAPAADAMAIAEPDRRVRAVA